MIAALMALWLAHAWLDLGGDSVCPMPPVRSDATPALEVAPGVRDLETVYRSYAPTVARWAARLAGPLVDVDDLVHEVFLVVRRRMPEFRGDAKITTWLYRITERVAQESRRKDRFRRGFSRARQFEIERTMASPHLTPVDEFERRQSAETVYRILDRLPGKYRNVLVLFEMEELSGEEIATLTGLKLATVWVHLDAKCWWRALNCVPKREGVRPR